MTDHLEMQFEFEELNVAVLGKKCPGIMLYGRACLQGDEDGFSVVSVRMKGGTWLRRRDNTVFSQPDILADQLFKAIADDIENPKTAIGRRAENDWACLVEDSLEPA